MRHLWPIQDRLELIALQNQKKQTADEEVKEELRAENDKELKTLLKKSFNVVIPDVQVCPNHTSPFRAFADAYFARFGVTVWKASRGLGGKSFLLALLGHTEAVTLAAEVTILGGSGEQSLRVLEYLQKLSGDEENTQRRTLYSTGGRVTALMASSKSARGPHPQRMRLDEVDEMELLILDAAMGQPMSSAAIPKQTVMSSTHHYADKTFTEVMRRAGEKGWPVYEWCYKETSAEPDGWLTKAEIESKRGEVTASMWAAEYDLQEPSPEGRAILPEAVDACFRAELNGNLTEAELAGPMGREIVIEAPVEGATYATGADWAKKKDFTVIDTLRTDVRPRRRVAWARYQRMSWPMMIAKFDARVAKYPGPACHDATGLGDVVGDYQEANARGIVLSGQTRADVFTKYIAAIEDKAIESARIRYCEGEHRYCTNEDLTGTGHPPDSFVAGAMAYRASSRRSLALY
jgi:hypothetical protein